MCHQFYSMIAWLFWKIVLLCVNHWCGHLSWMLYLHICDVHPASCLRKTNGIRVLLRACLASSYTSDPRCSSLQNPWEFGSFDEWLSLEYCYQWLKPVIPEAGYLLPWCRPKRIFSWGCVQEHLLPVSCVSQESEYIICLVLINVRSLTNKNFILNDFLKSHFLDFLLLTET